MKENPFVRLFLRAVLLAYWATPYVAQTLRGLHRRTTLSGKVHHPR
jgi:hypothetical protein